MLWGARGHRRMLMILGGIPFIRISCFVVGNVVPVSFFVLMYFAPRGYGGLILVIFFSFPPVYKLDYHGSEEGEHEHHH